ncbi:molybdopterin biosynthesis protein [Lasius niger]|uniref:Molybdopterin biosynthesis protein n=1 Tax=Lasius niger TaxID=67767 RepID=A0A0J7KFJ2_LASNI|nr:molybdopterin biosynthesis protein [Lasius niger]
MLTPEILERYSRQILLPVIGAKGQQRLNELKILVVGAGGLGAPLLPQLVGAGFGQIVVIDPDQIELGNLPRQTLYRTSDIGKFKAEMSAECAQALNPEVTVTPICEYLNAENAEEIISKADIVADGCDDPKTRGLVSDICRKLKKPLISGAVQGTWGQWASFPYHKNANIPCYRCLYPDLEKMQAGGCALAGVVGSVCATIAGMMGTEIFRMGLEWQGYDDEPRLYMWDAVERHLRKVRIAPHPNCPHHG